MHDKSEVPVGGCRVSMISYFSFGILSASAQTDPILSEVKKSNQLHWLGTGHPIHRNLAEFEYTYRLAICVRTPCVRMSVYVTWLEAA